jgi:hypothetical protein
VRVKPGVQFTVIDPGGFALLAAFHHAAQVLGRDITISSACDGTHSGPEDPHHLGKAYDLRISDIPDPELLLKTLQEFLGSAWFFVWIEDAGQPNQHIHAQVRKGIVYPPLENGGTNP